MQVFLHITHTPKYGKIKETKLLWAGSTKNFHHSYRICILRTRTSTMKCTTSAYFEKYEPFCWCVSARRFSDVFLYFILPYVFRIINKPVSIAFLEEIPSTNIVLKFSFTLYPISHLTPFRISNRCTTISCGKLKSTILSALGTKFSLI